MTRNVRHALRALAVAVALTSLAAGGATAQRRPRTQRPCPNVAPEGQVCTAFGQGRACRYGGGSVCVCRRMSARDRQVKWYCSG